MKNLVPVLIGISLLTPSAIASQPYYYQSVLTNLESDARVYQALRDCEPTKAQFGNQYKYTIHPRPDRMCRYTHETPQAGVTCTLPLKERNDVAQEHLASVYQRLHTIYTTGNITGTKLATPKSDAIMRNSEYCELRKK